MNVRQAKTAEALLSIPGLTCLSLNEAADNRSPLNRVRVVEPFETATKAVTRPPPQKDTQSSVGAAGLVSCLP